MLRYRLEIWQKKTSLSARPRCEQVNIKISDLIVYVDCKVKVIKFPLKRTRAINLLYNNLGVILINSLY